MPKGYTIIELLSVLSIIGIMASVSVPAYQAVQQEARITSTTAEIKTVQVLVERYAKLYGQLPPDIKTACLDQKTNITDKMIHDPILNGKTDFLIETGKTSDNKDYYVIYSPGLNKRKDFIITDDHICNQNDDVIVSNLMIIN